MEVRMLLRTIAFGTVALLFASSGNATTLYVAGNGSGTACTATAPCASLNFAVQAANVADTILCISPPLGGAIIISKSITIDCSSARAPVRDTGVGNGAFSVGISINIPANGLDPFRIVRLRGLEVDGFSAGSPFLDRGIDISAATAVYIEDCIISNAKHQGILDERTGGQTKLFIKDTIVSGNGGAGIAAAAAAVGIIVLDDVRSENNAYGLAAANGNNVTINRSTFSGNSAAGIEGDPGAQIIVDNSTIGHNNVGVLSFQSVRLSNNNIAFNNTAISGPGSGTFGNNRFSGNGTIGTPPAALGGATSDLGQQ
jgi:Right handed beta helix region